VASFKYLMLSSVGILFFLFGVFLVYRDVGVLSIAAVSSAIRASPALGDLPAMHLALAAICVGIGVRTAFVPFHTWLPEAHAYAPTPVSALLSGALIKISIFAMMRILRAFSGAYLNELLLWIGGATAVLAVVVALAQSDAKRLLAYHSVSQMGYVLAAFAAAGGLSTAASMAHAISHALFKSLLFLTVGAAVELTGNRNLYRMEPLGRRTPLLAIFYLVGALSIAGLPPFNGYVSKALVLESVSGSPVYVLLWITGAATIASFIKLSRIFTPVTAPRLAHNGGSPASDGGATEPRDGAVNAGAPGGRRPQDKTAKRSPGILLLIASGVLAAACVLGGVAGRPLAQALHRLAGIGPVPALPALYSARKLLSTGGALAAGVVLYLLAVSAPGRRAAGALRRYAPSLRSVLLLFLVGLVAFGAVAYL
jgi:multicomponent Na+:H+ antiporter subunit D